MRRAFGWTFVALVVFALAVGAAAPAFAADATSSSSTTSTTAPVPKTTHPGVRRVLVISLPATSWDDLDLTRLPNLKRLFARSAVADLSVRGVLVSRGSLVAMIEGPDKRTYIVHQGDKLLDGTIKSITPQGLIVEQVVNDPLSLVKRREIRKLLKTLEDPKG